VDADCAAGHVCTSEGDAAVPFCRYSWSMATSDTTISLSVPEGKQLVVFLVGGGGGASYARSGSSGFFRFALLGRLEGAVTATVDIGQGGGTDDDGETTRVTVTCDGVPWGWVWATGGGGDARPGWSGGANTRGGMNGDQGDYRGNGNGEKLPSMCNEQSSYGTTVPVKLAPGPAGTSSDGTGAGGVYINDRYPYRSSSYYDKYIAHDGWGYGAGGGEDERAGNEGAAAVFICVGL
jgi:hypothetical protein